MLVHFTPSAERLSQLSAVLGAMRNIFLFLCMLHAALAACPFALDSRGLEERDAGVAENLHPKRADVTSATQDFLNQFTLDDDNAFLTSDAGGPIADQSSLKAGERGPTLLEDFIFRQKIQHFDHERVSRPPTRKTACHH
jgi:catalase